MGGASGYIFSRSSHCNSDFFSSTTNSLLRWLCAVPMRLTVTERVFACSLHPTWSASLRGCERRDFVRCERQWTGWQPFSGSFKCRIIGLRGWPRTLAIICFMQRQTESGWRTNSTGSRSARRYNFPKRQGPRPKIALDPVRARASFLFCLP